MKTIKKYGLQIFILVIYLGLMVWLPDAAIRSSQITWDYFVEMAIIFPPVFVLMGLMEVWVPKDKIQKWLGSGSGIKGGAISMALGTLPTGPLYIAFPMTATLIRKGASITNMVIFLGSWAALKVPQLMIEIKFLGLEFTVLRFTFTLIALIIIGFLMEKILHRYPDKEWLQTKVNKAETNTSDKTKI